MDPMLSKLAVTVAVLASAILPFAAGVRRFGGSSSDHPPIIPPV